MYVYLRIRQLDENVHNGKNSSGKLEFYTKTCLIKSQLWAV